MGFDVPQETRATRAPWLTTTVKHCLDILSGHRGSDSTHLEQLFVEVVLHLLLRHAEWNAAHVEAPRMARQLRVDDLRQVVLADGNVGRVGSGQRTLGCERTARV